MSDPLYNFYQNVKTAREPRNTLKEKYFTEDAASKKFIVSKFNSHKKANSLPIMNQIYEIDHIISMFS